MPDSALPGIDGFLGTRASLMLDVVVLAMAAVLPLMFVAIQLARRKNFVWHKRLQLTIAALLLATVTAFEVDMRVHGWRPRAQASPYFGEGWNTVDLALTVHLVFAVSAAVLWVVVVARALRKFPTPPTPGAHSAWHRRWAWLAALDLVLTSVTGWLFYWLAFVA